MKELKYLLISASAVIVVLGIFLLVGIDQKISTVATANTVSFSGEGKILAKPDIAVVSFAIVTEATDSREAQDENSVKSKKVVDFLKKEGIDEKDIRTVGYNIYPQYKYPQYDKPEIRGYQVNQAIEAKIRDLSDVSKILDGVVEAGVNQVNNLSFTIDNPEKLKAEARAKAITDAKKKASELKGQIGLKLGKIVNFSENIGGLPPGPLYYAREAGGGGYGGGPSVPAGENEIVINVTITYQIK